MTTQVQATISGGRQYSTADKAVYGTIVTLLDDQANSCQSAASAWGNAQLAIEYQRSRLSWCAAANGTGTLVVAGTSCAAVADPTGAAAVTTTHTVLDYGTLVAQCGDAAAALMAVADECEALSSRVARAFSLYEAAEALSRRLVDEIVQFAAVHSPLATFGVAGLCALGGLAYSLATGDGVNWTHALNATTWMQQGLLAGIGSLATGRSEWAGLLATGETNAGATWLAAGSSRVKNLLQGDELTVVEVEPATPLVGSATGVADALADLRRLGTARLADGDDSGVDYGTIAISRYVAADGTASWLVTIPGTDGQWDSPFGWEQNLELMSDDASVRTQADSYRMVVEAMRMAGIGADDSVVLVGHSQGGIVAAAIASDCGDEFTISHIVTAGSPIANHPVADSTWVTAIEMEDELVAALDGDDNPSGETWLTVRGTLVDGSTATASGAPVMTDPDDYEITHWLEYHIAAYADATSLGSPALAVHEQHFAESIAGDYDGTTYYQGRMSHVESGTTTEEE
ncbi:PGAP1-like alpha/beta domain-containing protein [Bifidobacterium choloepi]|uniref:Alpha/beta fold hydrolase n=1 Tax=Bifidobacterium choloepi TaxID=2614131 RepID=A0A6I5N6F3_9BIFI|nr:Mbeg1-like protein [Bifidobacterium choloepi]NEG69381.1 alpha/beta fold hydrolase [Bifidobacterium choloepi]